MSIGDKYRISWEEACWRCDSEAFSFQCTDELVPLDHFIGQDRAQEARRFGLFEEVDPEDGLHRPVGTAVVHAVHGSKALLVNQGERLVSENLGPTSLQALSLLRRHQEPGLPEALLRVSRSSLPRTNPATTFSSLD